MSFAEDRWELYDTTTDWTQAHDLSAEHPEKLRQLQEQFLVEAAKHQVIPLDDRTIERFIPALAGRPDLLGTRTSMIFFAGMHQLPENRVPNVKNRSHTITADIKAPQRVTLRA